MNLRSPIYVKSNSAYSEGTLRVLNSSSVVVYTAKVYGTASGSSTYTYKIDLVRILSGICSLKFPGSASSVVDRHYFAYDVELYIDSTHSEAWISDGVFYYSEDDSCVLSNVGERYIAGYKYPLSNKSSGVYNVVYQGSGSSSRTTVTISASDDGEVRYVIPADYSTTVKSYLSIAGTEYTVDDCHDMQISYINRHGGWSVFVPQGNIYRTDSDTSKDAVSYVNNYRTNVKYHHEIYPTYSISSGWLTNDEAYALAKDLLESPMIFMQNVDYSSEPISCVVDASSINFMDSHRDDVMNLEFSLRVSVPLIKY